MTKEQLLERGEAFFLERYEFILEKAEAGKATNDSCDLLLRLHMALKESK